MYVRGLLLATGRKSMRNIAATSRHPASQQNLQQFVSNSTWHWEEIRQRLARILGQELKATSWVISPLIIPKAGNNTVGVETQFVPALGKLVNCQRAIGIWLARPGMSCPIDWHLILPPNWMDDAHRRRRASVPVDVKSSPPWGIGIDALVTIINDWGLPMRPVVMDTREADAAEIIQELRRLHIPFVVRVNRTTRFVQADRTGAQRYGDGEYSVESLGRILREQRRVVQWQGTEQGTQQGVLAAAIHVDLPHEAKIGVSDPNSVFIPVSHDMLPGQRELVLIAEWRDSVQGKPSFWVSNIIRMSVTSLLNCANLSRQVYRDQEQISRRFGLYDFEGRSFSGWHRHVTLVSMAHAFAALNCAEALFSDPPEPRGGSSARNVESPWQET
jgi:hypothetical protein